MKIRTRCKTCGKYFEIYPCYFKKAKYHFCSSLCRRKFLSEKWKGKGNPRFKEKILVKCMRCGKEFYVLPSEKRKYCSHECANKIPWNKGKSWSLEMRQKISITTKKAMKAPDVREKCRSGALFHLENSWKGFTKIERIIYRELKKKGLVPKRQYRLYEKRKLVGVVDFAFPNLKLIIECKGDYWHANPKFYKELNHIQKCVLEKDKLKETWARRNNWLILSFYEDQILHNTNECLDIILMKINELRGYNF